VQAKYRYIGHLNKKAVDKLNRLCLNRLKTASSTILMVKISAPPTGEYLVARLPPQQNRSSGSLYQVYKLYQTPILPKKTRLHHWYHPACGSCSFRQGKA